MKTYLLPPVTEKELATILTALRTYEANPVWTEHFEDVVAAPSAAYVGKLCMKLNNESTVCGS